MKLGLSVQREGVVEMDGRYGRGGQHRRDRLDAVRPRVAKGVPVMNLVEQ